MVAIGQKPLYCSYYQLKINKMKNKISNQGFEIYTSHLQLFAITKLAKNNFENWNFDFYPNIAAISAKRCKPF